jgi:aminoglycoside phosphotransferase (APT) family kinase protein
MGEYLKEVIDPNGADNVSKGGAACHILDMKYVPGSACTILYQLGQHMVIGTLNWEEGHEQSSGPTQLIAPLAMHVYRSEEDPALPGLVTALDPQLMARVLTETLPPCDAGAARVLRCRVTPLRYRPGKRCTVHLEVWLRNTETGVITRQMWFGKLYHSLTKAASVYEAMQALFDSAPARDGRVRLARPAAFVPELQLVLQEQIEGTPLDLLLGGNERTGTVGDLRGRNGVVHAAAALAALHTAGLSATRERFIVAELARFDQRAAQVATVNADLGARMAALAVALRASSEYLAAWGSETCFIHGDCKPSQFLIGPTHVGLLDFDHCGMADPASDVGTFLASLRQLNIRQALKSQRNPGVPVTGSAPASWLRELEQQFLEVYCATSGRRPEYRLRATWYEAVALLRKAVRAFARSPYSPLPSALVMEGAVVLAAVEGY